MTIEEEITPSDFREVPYGESKIFFDKKYVFHEHFQHKKKTRRFPYCKNILAFISENPGLNIYFTLDEKIKPFKKIKDGYLINIDSYMTFCEAIQSRTTGRAKAFLSQNLNLKDISATKKDKEEYIKANADEKILLEACKNLDPESKKNITDALNQLQPANQNDETKRQDIKSEEFILLFSKFLSDKDVQLAIIQNTPKIQIQILKAHVSFLKENLDKNETFIQNWIDEDDGKYRKQRCLIFGIDYVDPKREGRLSGKKFDVLAEQNRDNHVIIELKSPNADVFDIELKPNANGGEVEEFRISKELARAIPQVLGYKKWYGGATTEEIKELGLKEKKNISRCIIVIGQTKESEVWKENLNCLRSSLSSIDVYTYTDLIHKLENTIKNLEENL